MANPTIGATTPRIQYTATASQTVFTVPFEFLANADLAVYVNGTLKTLTTDYTLTGANTTGGGTLTFVTGRTAGEIITILGNLAYSRDTNKYTKYGLLPAEVLEADFDAVQVQAKQLALADQFALRVPMTDVGTPSLVLPAASSRADKALIFDASGNVTVSTDDYEDQVATVAASAAASAASASASAASASASAASASSSSNSASLSAASATSSAASATAANSSAVAAAASASSSATSATNSASSATNALAAAQASGAIAFYNTKALANSALAGLADQAVIEVLADESRNGRRTRYRKESGAYAFKLYLDTGLEIYCDSSAANDSADGFTSSTPKKTLAAAVALLKPGTTLFLARGSRWFETVAITTADVNVRPYKNGNRPVIDGSILVSGTWTNDATYTNLWYIDVTFSTATVGNYTSGAPGAWHPALFDEGAATRADEAYVQRVLKDDVVAGSTVTATTIAGLLTIANANAGSFTVHRTGSTNAEPRSDNGTQFRFYFYPSDGSNPNSNGRSVYVVGQTITAAFGSNNSVQDLVIQRTGGKDMTQMDYGTDITLGDFTRVDFLDAAVHATVVGGVEFRNCRAKACAHGDSYRMSGACYHQYTEVATKGFKIFDCESDGFATAVYSHGSGAAYDEHITFDIDGLNVRNCYNIIVTGSVAKGVRARRIYSRNVAVILTSGSTGNAVIEDSLFVNVTASVATITRKNYQVTLRRCFVYKDPTGSRLELLDPFTLGTILSSEYPTLILEDSTVIGAINDPGNSQRRQQNWKLTNSILHKTDAVEAGQWMLGTLVATNSLIGTTGQTLAMLRTQKVGVDATCLTQVVTQTFQRTFVAADITYTNSTRTGTYSGTPNGDGSASITMNYNNADWSRQIRFVDAYGSGSHYNGYIVSLGTAGSSQAITVYPAPSSAFTSKTLANGVSNFRIFGPTMEVSGTLDRDGAKIEVPDGTYFAAGTYVHIGAITSKQTAFGVRKVSSVSGNILTLDRACTWQTGLSVTNDWFDSLGSITNRGTLPSVAVTFGFPFIGRNAAGATYPKLTITPLIPTGVGSAVSITPSTTFGRIVGDAGTLAIGLGASAWSQNYDGVSETYGAFDYAKGWMYQGIGAAVGDVVKLEISAIIDDWTPQFASDPLSSGSPSLRPSTELVRLGIGYKRYNDMM